MNLITMWVNLQLLKRLGNGSRALGLESKKEGKQLPALIFFQRKGTKKLVTYCMDCRLITWNFPTNERHKNLKIINFWLYRQATLKVNKRVRILTLLIKQVPRSIIKKERRLKLRNKRKYLWKYRMLSYKESAKTSSLTWPTPNCVKAPTKSCHSKN